MNKKYMLALDQGTTSSRTLLFDSQAQVIEVSQIETTQIYPEAGWVEQDAKEILNSQLKTLKEVIEKKGVAGKDIGVVGITNQRESIVVWDKVTGEPVYNAIIWQCKRTANRCNRLKEDRHFQDVVRQKTGLIIDAYFSASKLEWLLDHIQGLRQRAKQGEVLFGTIDTWLLWNMSKNNIHATDYTNASRTMLFNIHTLDWDAELLEIFNIPKAMLPKAYPSSHNYGEIKEEILEGNVRIGSLVGDQQAALFGHHCFKKGMAKNTYGTGCFVLMNTGKIPVFSKNGLLTTVLAGTNEDIEYGLEGSVFIGGALIQWLRDGLQIIKSAKETEDIALSVESTNGVYLVPAFVGMGAPYWNQDARGIIVGLTQSVTSAHIVRAAVEAMAFQVRDVIKAMEEDSGIDIIKLKVDGGASTNKFLLQFQADILDIKVEKPQMIETTALGALFLAGLSSHIWKDKKAILELTNKVSIITPNMEKNKRKPLLDGWKAAINQL